MRTSDGHAMSTEQRSTCANPRCNCRRGGNPHAHELGIAHVGDYTIWLVGFVGTAWVPVALVQARTWFDARAKGEKIFAWVPRGRVEASSGNRLSLFVSNAAESHARYAERLRRSSTTSASSANQPHPQTPMQAGDSSGQNFLLVGGISSGLREVLRRSGVHIAPAGPAVGGS